MSTRSVYFVRPLCRLRSNASQCARRSRSGMMMSRLSPTASRAVCPNNSSAPRFQSRISPLRSAKITASDVASTMRRQISAVSTPRLAHAMPRGRGWPLPCAIHGEGVGCGAAGIAGGDANPARSRSIRRRVSMASRSVCERAPRRCGAAESAASREARRFASAADRSGCLATPAGAA